MIEVGSVTSGSEGSKIEDNLVFLADARALVGFCLFEILPVSSWPGTFFAALNSSADSEPIDCSETETRVLLVDRRTDVEDFPEGGKGGFFVEDLFFRSNFGADSLLAKLSSSDKSESTASSLETDAVDNLLDRRNVEDDFPEGGRGGLLTEDLGFLGNDFRATFLRLPKLSISDTSERLECSLHTDEVSSIVFATLRLREDLRRV
mmetsp:Transcript_21876/g.49755  ORF Transcript_21876/g.49755 Transcript_21876/m.49755 type:complete len:206 (-) Transcript_21876:1123-1740(-)